ncbi:pentapeptide repeat-containing protein [Streptomyces sp. NPDC057686]|uniref:pentapeptide repeat-containing protein n=1 Tax=Streptomyces sp. NPDC057686 TaxID=3346212 RepID=UPI0036AF41AC
MTATSSDGTTSWSPSWPHCGHDAGPDSAGCRGRSVDPHTACLAHLADADRSVYLAGLQTGADIDHRGTPLSVELLSELLAALTDPATNRPHLGNARFEFAVFSGNAGFDEARISGDARFLGAEMGGDTRFHKAEISGCASFDRAKIGGRAVFDGVRIGGDASFDRTTVRRRAVFDGARIGGDAGFDRMKVAGRAVFDRAAISGDARFFGAEVGGFLSFDHAEVGADAVFDRGKFTLGASFRGVKAGGNVSFRGAVFESAAVIGPLVCARTLTLSEAEFRAMATIEAATAAVHCRRTRWASAAALRLRYAVVDLSDAVLEYPVSLTARSRPFTVFGQELSEPDSRDSRVRVASLRGVDTAHLVLSDVDLTDCRFAGAVHLDELRLEGRCPLPAAPSGLRWRGVQPVRWTPRRTLAEEQHWRATRHGAADGWTPAPDRAGVLEPAALASSYRQLRKAFEDGKNEPGAADFYYGEMEMRRHDPDTSRAERGLLTAYWALSGYGLRASRALGWLLAAMTATVVAMMLWGLPQDDPKPVSTGTFTGRSITLTAVGRDPVNPVGPYQRRLSTERFDKSLQVVINSVVFRASGQNLTTAGTYTEMAARLVEPVLLGLAVLAIRGRVKR